MLQSSIGSLFQKNNLRQDQFHPRGKEESCVMKTYLPVVNILGVIECATSAPVTGLNYQSPPTLFAATFQKNPGVSSMLYTALAVQSVSSFVGAAVVSAASMNTFIEGNGLSDKDVEMMEFAEEQVGEPIIASSLCYQKANCMPCIIILISGSRIPDYC